MSLAVNTRHDDELWSAYDNKSRLDTEYTVLVITSSVSLKTSGQYSRCLRAMAEGHGTLFFRDKDR